MTRNISTIDPPTRANLRPASKCPTSGFEIGGCCLVSDGNYHEFEHSLVQTPGFRFKVFIKIHQPEHQFPKSRRDRARGRAVECLGTLASHLGIRGPVPEAQRPETNTLLTTGTSKVPHKHPAAARTEGEHTAHETTPPLCALLHRGRGRPASGCTPTRSMAGKRGGQALRRTTLCPRSALPRRISPIRC